MHSHIFTEVVINTPVSVVWDILADLERYGEWNPFIPGISGTLVTGATLAVTLHQPGKKPMKFSPKLLFVEREQEIRWFGSLITRGLFDGEHVFHLDPIDEKRVRFIQQEEFSGILVQFFQRTIDTHTRAGFKAMNKALKKRAELLHEAHQSTV